MNNAFRFLNLRVYQQAKELHLEVYHLTEGLPPKLNYLRDQLNRASLSPVLNIAEGSGKQSDRDFNRYLGNSLGSVYETVAGLDVLQSLTGAKVGQLNKRYQDLRNQLGSFSKKLKAEG